MLNQVKYRKTLLLLTTLFVITLTTVLLIGIHPISSLVHARTESVKEQVKLVNISGNSKEIIIHRYSAPPHDQVNSYWIETDEGVIIVDAQRFLSQARYLAEEIRMVTNKPLLGIFITHHHTDHLGGLPALVEAFDSNVPIYSSQFVHDDIETDGYGFLARRKELHGNDFPAPEDIPLPNQIVADRDKIELGGLIFEAIEFQDNELEEFPKAYGEFVKATQQLANIYPKNVKVVNFYNSNGAFPTPMFSDTVHLTDKANTVLAEKLYHAITAWEKIQIVPQNFYLK